MTQDRTKDKPKQKLNVAGHIRLRLVSGVVLLVPLVVTFFVLRFVFRLILGLAEPFGKLLTPTGIPEGWWLIGISLAALLLLIYLAGALTTLVLGKKLVVAGEMALSRIPLVRTIYSSARQAMDMISGAGHGTFRSVVLVEFPKAGLTSIGFTTGEVEDAAGRKCYKVFIPTVPNITGGFLIVAPRDGVKLAAMSVEEGIKMALSGGLLSPDRLVEQPESGKP
ncbi:MAG: DUF502 domain-containing protein [Verrucomicrobiota bacterium]|nr:DUF502 domain-containing protein [Verrucomicrobiota bacterium]